MRAFPMRDVSTHVHLLCTFSLHPCALYHMSTLYSSHLHVSLSHTHAHTPFVSSSMRTQAEIYTRNNPTASEQAVADAQRAGASAATAAALAQGPSPAQVAAVGAAKTAAAGQAAAAAAAAAAASADAEGPSAAQVRAAGVSGEMGIAAVSLDVGGIPTVHAPAGGAATLASPVQSRPVTAAAGIAPRSAGDRWVAFGMTRRCRGLAILVHPSGALQTVKRLVL